jgi:crossover junction endodeoxyribonuclease RuvC
MRVYLGVDPGLTLGFGVVKEDRGRLTCLAYGAIRTRHDRSRSMRADVDARLAEITDRLDELLLIYSPDRIGIEEFRFYRQNVTSSIKLGNVLGALKTLFRERGIPYTEFSAQELKVAVTGYRNAAKDQVQRMVRHILRLDDVPRPQHAADALAAAIAVSHRNGFGGEAPV